MKPITYTLALLLGVATASPVDLPPRVPAYMSTPNYWRDKAGLPRFAWNAQLEANALKAAIATKGQSHVLYPGSWAQVIVGTNDFPAGYVLWLCEVPEPYMGSSCLGKGPYDTTGHHDVLVSRSYTKIGCANAYNAWFCDLA